MDKGFAALPAHGPRLVLANATVPGIFLDNPPVPPDEEGLVRADIVVNESIVEQVMPAGGETGLPSFDLDRGMVWPTFVDMHTHIDKGHIWPRKPNPDGTFDSALAAVVEDREAEWTAGDVERRMDFSLRAAYAHGTSLLRTHLDSAPPQHLISWPVFAGMRERWAGRVDLQAVSILPVDLFLDAAFADELVGLVAECGGVLGAVTFMMPELDEALDVMMRRAAAAGLDLDFHVDESADPTARSLRHIADAAIRNGFPGRIVAGHCCSLAVQPAEEADATMERVAEALRDVTGGNRTAEVLGIAWTAAIASGLVDNIPFTAAMVPVVRDLSAEGSDVTWWSLSLGACYGGNLTLIGASANLVAAGALNRANRPLSFVSFMKYGIPATMISMAIGSLWLLLLLAVE